MKRVALLKSESFRGLAILVLFVIGLLAGLWIYRSLTWQDRTLKLALKLDEIPPSLKVLELREDTWTDQVVSGRFTIHPEDFPAILKGRNFKETTWLAEHVSPKEGRVTNHWYEASGIGFHLDLKVDEKKEFGEFTYSTD